MQEKGVNPAVKSYRSDLELAPIETVLPVFTPENISTCFSILPKHTGEKIKDLAL